MAANGRRCPNDHHFLVPATCRRGFRSRFDDADHFHARRRFDLIERQRGGRVAGDHQQVRTLILQIAHRPHRVMRDRDR